MTVAIIIAAIVLTYAAISLYIRKAREYLDESEAPWNRLFNAAKAVVEDPDMPDYAASFSAAAVICAGCGCLTRRVLWDEFVRRFKSDQPRRYAPQDWTKEQRKRFSDVIVNALYYDSLRAPVSGLLLRRIVLPGLRAASEGSERPRREAVARIEKSSRAAIRHRSAGRKYLEMA